MATPPLKCMDGQLVYIVYLYIYTIIYLNVFTCLVLKKVVTQSG